jgi:hypothetical protein
MTIIYAPRSPRRKPTARPTEPTSANADRPPAIVTGRKPGEQRAGLPEMTSEEHERRGDAAEALWRELVRRSADGT